MCIYLNPIIMCIFNLKISKKFKASLKLAFVKIVHIQELVCITYRQFHGPI